jgi:hypothetical protein
MIVQELAILEGRFGKAFREPVNGHTLERICE